MSKGPFHTYFIPVILLGWVSQWKSGFYIIFRDHFFNQLYSAECFFKPVFNFSSICESLKLFQWRCRPSRNFICMDCSTAYTNLLSLITCVGTQEPIKTPKSLKGRKAKQLFNLQQTHCYWKIFLKKHSSWAILLRPCQVFKLRAVVRGSREVQKDKNEWK